MKKIKYIIIAIVITCIAAFCLIYTRPRTVEQRYPYLDVAQSIRIEGNYTVGTSTEFIPFAIAPGEAHFEDLIERVRSAGFKTRLSNILPKTTSYHRASEDGINWDIEFVFDKVALPDGSISSGAVLSVQYFYDVLTLTVNGEIVSCTVENEAAWAQEIMDMIRGGQVR